MKEKTDDMAWLLIAKHLGNELNEKEKEDFDKWEKSSGLHHMEVEKAEKIWDLSKNENPETFNTDKGWNKIHNRIHKKSAFTFQPSQAKFRIQPIIRIAAAILIVLGLGIGMRYYIHEKQYTTVYAQNQNTTKPIILPDGTKVFLNTGATVKYPKNFGSIRKIELTGEAFFNVTHHKDVPFVIQTAHAQIKVLGTSFNVLANKESDSTQVVVETGTVELTPKDASGKILLTKGNTGVYYANSKKLVKSEIADVNTYAWKTKALSFKNAKLGYVVRMLQKQFSKTIRFNNEKLNNYQLTADYIDLDLDSILKLLQTSHCLEIKKINNDYIISGPGC